jgi:hypothetical protein
MAFVRGRTSFEERSVESVVPLSATPLTAGSLSGPLARAEGPMVAAPDTDCASELSLAGGARSDRDGSPLFAAPASPKPSMTHAFVSHLFAIAVGIEDVGITTYLRPAPWASAGTRREEPASRDGHRGRRPNATQVTRPAREACPEEENRT